MLEGMEDKLDRIERSADPALREAVRDIVRSLLDCHASAFERMLATARGEGVPGLIEKWTFDPKIAPLFLLHGLHPTDLGTRVVQALEGVRPYLHSHGGNVELLGIEGGRVRLRLEGSCQGCPSSVQTLKNSIEDAITRAAPEVAGIEVL